MASVYSAEVAVGSYNRIRLRIDYSGSSGSCHIEFRRTSTWTDTWGDDAASITFNGQTISAPYWYTGTVDGTWREIDSASGYTIPTGGGTFSWSFNHPLTGSVLDCSGTITLPSQTVAPSGGFVSSVVPGSNNFTITGGVTSFGTPSTGNVELVVLQSAFTQSGLPQYYETFSTLSGTATVSTNSQKANNPTFGISPNTTYYIGVYANNGSLDYRYDAGQYTTLAAAPTITAGTTTLTSIQLNYSVTSDGGVYSKDIQYSLDGGATWTTGATIPTGSYSTGSFTISGLTSGTAYTIQTRVSTTAGATAGPTLSVSTRYDVHFYGSVNSLSKEVEKMYGPVNCMASFTPTVDINQDSIYTSLDVSVFIAKMKADHLEYLFQGAVDWTTSKLRIVKANQSPGYQLAIYDQGGAQEYRLLTAGLANIQAYGFTLNTSAATNSVARLLVTDITWDTVTKEIVKLYGSVNGLSKVMFEG